MRAARSARAELSASRNSNNKNNNQQSSTRSRSRSRSKSPIEILRAGSSYNLSALGEQLLSNNNNNRGAKNGKRKIDNRPKSAAPSIFRNMDPDDGKTSYMSDLSAGESDPIAALFATPTARRVAGKYLPNGARPATSLGLRYSSRNAPIMEVKDHDDFCDMIDKISQNLLSLKTQVSRTKATTSTGSPWVPSGSNGRTRSGTPLRLAFELDYDENDPSSSLPPRPFTAPAGEMASLSSPMIPSATPSSTTTTKLMTKKSSLLLHSHPPRAKSAHPTMRKDPGELSQHHHHHHHQHHHHDTKNALFSPHTPSGITTATTPLSSSETPTRHRDVTPPKAQSSQSTSSPAFKKPPEGAAFLKRNGMFIEGGIPRPSLRDFSSDKTWIMRRPTPVLSGYEFNEDATWIDIEINRTDYLDEIPLEIGDHKFINADMWLDSIERLIDRGNKYTSFAQASVLDKNFEEQVANFKKLSEENDYWWSKATADMDIEESMDDRTDELDEAAARLARERNQRQDSLTVSIAKIVADYIKDCHRENIAPVSSFVSSAAKAEIALGSYGLGQRGCVVLSKAVSKLAKHRLTSIDVHDNSLDDVACAALVTAIDACTTITKLDISVNNIGPGGAEHMAIIMGGLGHQSLVNLNLAQNSIRDRGAVAIANSLGDNTSIVKLDMSGNQIGGRGAAALGEALTRNEAMIDLNLKWNFFRSSGAIAFCKGLAQNCTLRTLNLAWNGFGDVNTIAHLCDALVVATSLTELDLTHNRIMDRAAIVLAHTLERTLNIQTIKVNHNPLGQRGGRALMKALQLLTAQDTSSEVTRKVEMYNCSTSFANPETFDPQNSAGSYTLDLEDPYSRVVLHELALLVLQGKGHFDTISMNTGSGRKPFSLPALTDPNDDLIKYLPNKGIVQFRFASAQKPPKLTDCLKSKDLDTIRILLLQCNSASEVDSLVSMIATDAVLTLEQAFELLSYIRNPHIRVQFVRRYITKILLTDAMTEKIHLLAEELGITFSVWRLAQQSLLDILTPSEKKTFFRGASPATIFFHPNNPAGHYSIDLLKEREIALLLMAHRNSLLQEAAANERAPSGPMPNNTRPERVFLNLTIDGLPVKLHKFWKLPEEGLMELDFFNIIHPPDHASPIHDMELNIFMDEVTRSNDLKVRLNATRHVMNEHYFTCAQVKRILSCHEPDFDNKRAIFSEIYSRIIDYHGYLDVLASCFVNEEQIKIRKQMGWHTLFDETAAVGFYLLDLTDPSDRYTLAQIVRLAVVEPGENMDSGVFNDLPFDVPGSWVNEIPFKSPGVFSVYYCRTDSVINKAISKEKPHSIPPNFTKFQPGGNDWVNVVKRNKIKVMLSRRFKSPEEMFHTVDSDGGGSLSRQELARGLRSVGVYLEPMETTYLMEFLDEDGSGEIELDEVISFWNSTV